MPVHSDLYPLSVWMFVMFVDVGISGASCALAIGAVAINNNNRIVVSLKKFFIILYTFKLLYVSDFS